MPLPATAPQKNLSFAEWRVLVDALVWLASYDGSERGFDAACELLDKQGVAAIVYMSPSHTEDRPRWRALRPLLTELPPERPTHMMGRVNSPAALSSATRSRSSRGTRGAPQVRSRSPGRPAWPQPPRGRVHAAHGLRALVCAGIGYYEPQRRTQGDAAQRLGALAARGPRGRPSSSSP